MTTLGGSVFIRNAIKLDYCIEESIRCLLDIVDDMVVLDCQSDDGTTDLLRELASRFPKIRLFENGNWGCASDYNKLRLLANDAIRLLNTDWHFMIQGDEVLHENSLPVIRHAIETPLADAYLVRRLNLFGNHNHHVKFDSPKRPCGDAICRLARKGIESIGDAETLGASSYGNTYLEQIVLFHYGFVRGGPAALDKHIEVQTWFAGAPDSRLVELKNTTNKYDPEKFISWDHLTPIPMPHPKIMEKWVADRIGQYPNPS
jgi:hypothetical protein